jgi:anthranilate phosphoribosyltransferase
MNPQAILERLLAGGDLGLDEAAALMESIMAGELDAAQLAAILIALRCKGETVEEIAGLAQAMRARALPVVTISDDLVDTCGTGGDGLQTFNISTAAALVAAAMGIRVAKHGNRAVSSRCGSADLLEALGVRIDLSPESAGRLIDEVGIGFLFAPRHHPAMRHAATVRRQLGVRTVFNLLGPLTNPAGVRRQLMGVYRADLTQTMARVLQTLGVTKAFVVHGLDGTDEVTVCADTLVSVLDAGEVRTIRFAPEDADLPRAGLDALRGGTVEENAAQLLALLEGANGARRDAVLLNAGFVAMAADRAADIREGVGLARAALDSGRARCVLQQLREASQALGRAEQGGDRERTCPGVDPQPLARAEG